jgi:hypothetical protein
VRGGVTICPKCGMTQSMTRDNGGFEALAGIEVKK